MTVIVTRAVVVVVRIEATTMDAANTAFFDLSSRVHWSLPKLRFGDVRIKEKSVSVHSVSERGTIGKATT